MSFLAPWRDLCNRTLVHLSYSAYRLFLLLRRRPFFSQLFIGAFFQPGKVEPNIIVPTVVR